MTDIEPTTILTTDPALKTAIEATADPDEFQVITDDNLPGGADVTITANDDGYEVEMGDWGWSLHSDPAIAAYMLITPIKFFHSGWDDGYREGERDGYRRGRRADIADAAANRHRATH